MAKTNESNGNKGTPPANSSTSSAPLEPPPNIGGSKQQINFNTPAKLIASPTPPPNFYSNVNNFSDNINSSSNNEHPEDDTSPNALKPLSGLLQSAYQKIKSMPKN